MLACIHTPTHPHTYIHKALPTVYYGCYLVIPSDLKAYQQCFKILLKYKKL